MEWGYGWGHGPVPADGRPGRRRRWRRGRRRARPRGPAARGDASLASGRTTLLRDGRDGAPTVFGPAGVVALPERPGVVDLARVKERGGLRKKNAGASLVDLGDGCALVEFHSKMNALGPGHLRHAPDRGEGGQGELRRPRHRATRASNFTVGANLMLVLLAVQEEEWDELGSLHPPVPERQHGARSTRTSRWWRRPSASPWAAAARSPSTAARVQRLGRDLHGPRRGRGWASSPGAAARRSWRCAPTTAARASKAPIPSPSSSGPSS